MNDWGTVVAMLVMVNDDDQYVLLNQCRLTTTQHTACTHTHTYNITPQQSEPPGAAQVAQSTWRARPQSRQEGAGAAL